MIKVLILLASMTIATGAQAEIYMCKKPSGETEFSDTPCKAGSSSEVIPDRDHVSQEQQDAARSRLEQQKRELNERAAQSSVEAPANTMPTTPPPPPVEEVYGGGCYDTVRGRGTYCAEDPYRRPIERPIERPIDRPIDRPINRPAPRPSPR